MKRLITGLAFTLVLGVNMTMANDTKVSRYAEESFKKEFSGAEHVNWQRAGDYYLATFNYQGQRLNAYFNEEGQLHTTTRFVEYKSLPLNVVKKLQEKFTGGAIDDAVLEVAKTSGTTYLVTVNDSKKKYVVEADAGGNISIVKKQKLG
jgi:hypothetical protein